MPDAGSGPWFFKAPDAGMSDEVGLAVALSRDGRTVAIATALGEGAVYVFSVDAGVWAFDAKLQPAISGASDTFGLAIALSADGRTLAAGAPNESGSGTGANPPVDGGKPSSGAVYVFDRGAAGWAQTAYLKGFDSDSQDLFGTSVALTDDGLVLAAGAPGEDGVIGDSTVNTSSRSGCVWLIRRSTASLPLGNYQYVKPTGSAPNDAFGSSVAVSSDATTLAAGATGRADAGAAFAFVKTGATYTQQAELRDMPATPGAQLGYRIALSASGAALAAGAPLRDGTAGVSAGAVLVYERSFSVWGAPVVLEGIASAAGFGRSVALSASGAVLAAGDPSHASAGPRTGAVFWYERQGGAWPRSAPWLAPNAGPSDELGASVALSGDGSLLLAGAPLDDEPQSSGAAWLFLRR